MTDRGHGAIDVNKHRPERLTMRRLIRKLVTRAETGVQIGAVERGVISDVEQRLDLSRLCSAANDVGRCDL